MESSVEVKTIRFPFPTCQIIGDPRVYVCVCRVLPVSNLVCLSPAVSLFRLMFYGKGKLLQNS